MVLEKPWILALVYEYTHVGIFGFEVYHELSGNIVLAVEHNSQTFKVQFDTFDAKAYWLKGPF